jgi:hypothetical protein
MHPDQDMEWDIITVKTKEEVIEWGHYNEELDEWIYL